MDDVEEAARTYRQHMMTRPPNREHPHTQAVRALTTHGWAISATPGSYILHQARGGPTWHVDFDDTGQFLQASGRDHVITHTAEPDTPDPHQAALHAFLTHISKGTRR